MLPPAAGSSGARKKENPLQRGPAHRTDVEGTIAVPPEQAVPAKAGAVFDVAVTVEVQDGWLTISDASLAAQACLAAVEITAVQSGQKWVQRPR